MGLMVTNSGKALADQSNGIGLTRQDKKTAFMKGDDSMWISNPLVGWKCSECGGHIVMDVQNYGEYCPICGYHHKKELKTVLFKGKCRDGRVRMVEAKTPHEVYVKYADVIEVDHVI